MKNYDIYVMHIEGMLISRTWIYVTSQPLYISMKNPDHLFILLLEKKLCRPEAFHANYVLTPFRIWGKTQSMEGC